MLPRTRLAHAGVRSFPYQRYHATPQSPYAKPKHSKLVPAEGYQHNLPTATPCPSNANAFHPRDPVEPLYREHNRKTVRQEAQIQRPRALLRCSNTGSKPYQTLLMIHYMCALLIALTINRCALLFLSNIKLAGLPSYAYREIDGITACYLWAGVLTRFKAKITWKGQSVSDRLERITGRWLTSDTVTAVRRNE